MSEARKTSVAHTKVGDTLRHVSHNVSAKVEEFGKKAGDKSDELISRGSEVSENIKQEVEDYTEVVTDYIKEHPIKSALFATLGGFLIARIFRR